MLCDRALDGVVDVEELGVEEDLLARSPARPLGEVDAAGEDELQPDLVEGDAVAEPRDHRLGLADGRHVEGDDQAVAGGNGSIARLFRGRGVAWSSRIGSVRQPARQVDEVAADDLAASPAPRR